MRNRGYAYREVVGPVQAGRTVLAHLAGTYHHSPPEEWRLRIDAGQVDGCPAGPEAILQAGQALIWHRPPWDEPDVPAAFAVLHRDRDLLAVAKPPGLPTLPGGGFLAGTLLSLVRRRWPEAAPVHRLGRGTSGIVLFARTPRARSTVTAALRRREVRKDYRALVSGCPRRDEFVVDVPIGAVRHRLLGTVHAASADGREAQSTVRVLERREGNSVVAVRIATGRPHQIRIHLAAAGHPLTGDPLYQAGGSPRDDALPGDTGYLLHALSLELRHPKTRAQLDLFCGPPETLRRRDR